MIHVLTSPKWAPIVAPIVPGSIPVFTDPPGGECLLAFNCGVVVSAAALFRYKRAYNFHAGPPEFPGRDPHHWAVYEGVNDYGVTCHVMTERVDEGAIIDVERFGRFEMEAQELRRYAEARPLAMFVTFAPFLARKEATPSGHKWTGKKRRRADLLAMLDLSHCNENEAARRRRAFAGFPFVSASP